ncbi:MAG TPA: GTP-binding protein [Caldilineaceae bacterium]|nr:GTP-binding protein [Caldilineaceae bacterium]
MAQNERQRVRLIIAGGFLGAGKTTLLLTAARRLAERGYRVGLITNDQGEDLVDTALGEGAEIPVTEVAGGCFCCRFPDLIAGLDRLKAVADPHVILAEPVGSCTDLVATVLRPLIQFHPEQYDLAPLTVLHDGTRDLAGFPADVAYLYQQQLAEAELLLLNKCDLLDESAQRVLVAQLQAVYPQAEILTASAHSGDGIDAWLEIVLGQQSRNPETLLIDYGRYADAEAALGWLNVKGTVRSDEPFAVDAWSAQLLERLGTGFAAQQAAIAHIKTLVTAGTARFKGSLTQSGAPLSWDLHDGEVAATQLDFLLNVRVNAAPPILEQVVTQTVEALKPAPAARYYFTHFECFSPLPPEPTHRLREA